MRCATIHVIGVRDPHPLPRPWASGNLWPSFALLGAAMPVSQVELRGSAEAVLGRGTFRLASSGPYTAADIIKEVAACSPALGRQLLTSTGQPRDAVKVLVGTRIPAWDEVIPGGDVRVISTLHCDG